MKVTEKNIVMDSFLVEKLDLMIDRVVNHKFDNLLILDGMEGMGKSNLAFSIAYYLAQKSGREFNLKENVFFTIDDFLNCAIKTEKKVLLWDESCLGALASESYNKIQTKLLKLLMTARKKQHMYLFVIPKFYRLREAIIDRSVGLVHVYSPNQITRGRFAYYMKSSLEALYDYWKRTHKKGYKNFYSFLGTFSEALPKIVDEAEYDRMKDDAIATIGQEKPEESKKFKNIQDKLKALQYAFSMLPSQFPEIKQKELSSYLKTSERTLITWKKRGIDKEIGFEDDKNE